jgi:hypothetical protein
MKKPTRLTLIMVDDDTVLPVTGNVDELVRTLRRYRCAGGYDNVPALVQAWDLASQSTNGAVVWIHGAQPVLIGSTDGLQQRLERSRLSVPIYELCVNRGNDRILESLDGFYDIHSLISSGEVKTDVQKCLTSLIYEGKTCQIRRQSVSSLAEVSAGPARETSAHLVRLWAKDRVVELQRARQTSEAMKLAQSWQLVTPISGAVVLESQAQYDRAGLQPVSAETVPVIPEPAITWLLLLGMGIWILVRTAKARFLPDRSS